jgi:hypothetical protein
MGRRKIAIKNLRLGAKRIPDGIWRQAADNLLPGAEPTLNERKNGSPSKAMVMEGLCAVDPTWRKKMKAECAKLMAAPLKAQAAKAGWIAPSESSTAIAEYRAMWESIEQSEIARDGRSTLTGALHDPENDSNLARQLRGELPLPESKVDAILAHF